MPTPDLLTVAQAASELHISRRAVVHRIAAGTLPAEKIGDGLTSAYVINREAVEQAKSARGAA
jgi:excisionase family DNA binding protein